MMKIEAITFDNYKTLTYGSDSVTDIMPLVLDLLEEKIGKINGFMEVYRKLDERYYLIRNTNHVEVRIKDIALQALYELDYILSDIREIVEETFDDYMEERGFTWYPEVHSTIDNLRDQGYKLGLVSNIHWPVSRSMRKALGEMFDVVTFSLTNGMRKPHEAIFHSTLRQMDVPPGLCAHVGDDYEADIIGAKKAGMYAVHVQREGKQEAPQADKIITSLDELENIFSRYSR